MAERIFTLADLDGVASVCGCLSCRLGAAFSDHLSTVRTGYPGPVVILGHRTAAPGTTAVPHLVALRAGGELTDLVVWEEMRPEQLAAWLPHRDARVRVPQLSGRIPRLIRIRQALRSGAFKPSGATGDALSGGRYPSFRFLLEHWPALTKEFAP